MKFQLIQKFFLTTINGKFRYSFLLPILGAIIGSYIIFITLSIMNGMGKEIEEKLNSLQYNYLIHQL